MSRIKPLLVKSKGRSPSYNMRLLLESVPGTTIVPTPNKYYTFVYNAKTRGIRYDQHPFITCSNVYNWGFTGFNFHWNEMRRYTWKECATNLIEIYEDEFQDMTNFNTALFRTS